MSAYDSKRTSALFLSKRKGCYDLLSLGGDNEAARVHHASWHCGGCVSASCAGAARYCDWVPQTHKAEESGHLVAAVREGLRDSGYPTDKVVIDPRWGD